MISDKDISSSNFKSMNLKSMFAEFQQIRETDNKYTEKIEIKNTFSEFENYTCPFCRESTLLVDEGSFVCTNCGKENGSVISDKQEWCSYADSNDNADTARCGMPSNPLLPEALTPVAIQFKTLGFENNFAA